MEYAERLLEWFKYNKREMPWRKTSDSYAIWVSEVMLQQTQVDTVIPYYERFMERFPTIHDLAISSLEEVHHYWQGLGYYRRAENLQKGAKMVDERWQGVFPKDPKLVKEIPGIGPYTMGAILSIAFHIPFPAVDGNVMRILSRQFLIDADIAVAKNRKIFETQVMQLMPDDPNGFNQALMELGALVCTPKNPKCTSCPVNSLCMANQYGTQMNYPVKTKKVKSETLFYKILVMEKEGSYWMEKRPQEGLLANLWGFPMMHIEEWETFKLDEKRIKTLEPVTHIFTHRRWEMLPVIIPFEEASILKNIIEKSEEGKFVTLKEMKEIPIATAFKKVIKQLR